MDPDNQVPAPAVPALQQQLNAQSLADALRPFLTPAIAYNPPNVVSPQYRHQVDLNAEVINLLMSTAENRVDKAIDKLKERNALLSLAEGNPSVFKMAESMKNLEHFAKGTSDSSALLSAAMLASAFSEPPADKRKRPNSDRPFRARGVETGYSAPQSYPQAYPLFMQQQPFSHGFPRGGGSGLRGGTRFRASPPCYNCGESGHFMATCPNKR